MRILNILSGVAVLFATLAFGHLLHHYFTHASSEDVHSLSFLAGMAFGGAVAIFSFIGACLLLRRSR
jgi:F0F1-type ATP synthase membrane subunit c/vacuolar-type H+-ATPase subunit K